MRRGVLLAAPLQCEKHRDATELRARFNKLDREDLEAISRQSRGAFYRWQ